MFGVLFDPPFPEGVPNFTPDMGDITMKFTFEQDGSEVTGSADMSAIPEAKLAREAELCYALICMVTDYDCWRTEDDDVDIQMVIANLLKNADGARTLLQSLVPAVLRADRNCVCKDACANAIITAPEHRPAATVAKLKTLLPRHFE